MTGLSETERVALRPELPVLPPQMRSLPVDARGYPVPWFVQWIDGVPDHRIVDSRKFPLAIRGRRCWICGKPLGHQLSTFVVGPMCAVNRISSEPPSHEACATFAAKACPFLTRPHAKRRDANLPEDSTEPAGVMLKRNPGVTLLWTCRKYTVLPQRGGGVLFDIGHPVRVHAFAEGRRATSLEIAESIESGLPLLVLGAQLQDNPEAAVANLSRVTGEALRLLGVQ